MPALCRRPCTQQLLDDLRALLDDFRRELGLALVSVEVLKLVGFPSCELVKRMSVPSSCVRPSVCTHLHDAFREVRELRDMDTETLVAYAFKRFRMIVSDCKRGIPTRFDLVQQRDIAIAALRVRVGNVRDNVKVLNMFDLLVECGQLVEVGREHAECVYLGRDVPVCATLLDGSKLAIERERTQRWPMPGRIRRMSTSLSPCQYV